MMALVLRPLVAAAGLAFRFQRRSSQPTLVSPSDRHFRIWPSADVARPFGRRPDP